LTEPMTLSETFSKETPFPCCAQISKFKTEIIDLLHFSHKTQIKSRI
jgi:hypothetical protein